MMTAILFSREKILRCKMFMETVLIDIYRDFRNMSSC